MHTYTRRETETDCVDPRWGMGTACAPCLMPEAKQSKQREREMPERKRERERHGCALAHGGSDLDAFATPSPVERERDTSGGHDARKL